MLYGIMKMKFKEGDSIKSKNNNIDGTILFTDPVLLEKKIYKIRWHNSVTNLIVVGYANEEDITNRST